MHMYFGFYLHLYFLMYIFMYILHLSYFCYFAKVRMYSAIFLLLCCPVERRWLVVLLYLIPNHLSESRVRKQEHAYFHSYVMSGM